MHDHLILAIAAALGIFALALGYIAWEVRRAELDAEDAEWGDLRRKVLDLEIAHLEAECFAEDDAAYRVAAARSREFRAEWADIARWEAER